jgi:hypothetical protein
VAQRKTDEKINEKPGSLNSLDNIFIKNFNMLFSWVLGYISSFFDFLIKTWTEKEV